MGRVEFIKAYISGGSVNQDITQSIGGNISNKQIASGAFNNLYKDITSELSSSGITIYRCFYFKNESPSITFTRPHYFMITNLPAYHRIALGISGVNKTGHNGNEEKLANETTTPPLDISNAFAVRDSYENAVVGHDLAPGDTQSIWIKKIIPAFSAPFNKSDLSITCYQARLTNTA